MRQQRDPSTSHKRKQVRQYQTRANITQISQVKLGRHISTKQVRSTLVSGKVTSVMELASRPGKMVQNMLVSGKKTELMAKASFTTRMVIFMMDNGLMTWRTAVGFTRISTVPSTRVSGRITSSMASELRLGLTIRGMRESMNLEISTVLVLISGHLDQCTSVIGMRTR